MRTHRRPAAAGWLSSIAACLLLLAAATPAAADDAPVNQGDPAAGKLVFKARCGPCHKDIPGRNAIGPALFGVYMRPSGIAPGFSYSAQFKALNVVWDDAMLNRYITGPRAMVPGIKMSFIGLKNEQQRADVIAYLKTLK